MVRILTLFSMLLSAVLCACSGPAENADSSKGSSTTTSVVLAEATVQPMEDIFQFVGTARSDKSVVLTDKVAEEISTINFEDGNYVEEGIVFVEMTSDETFALLNGTLANPREHDRNSDSIRTLFAEETGAISDFDKADTKLKTSQSRVNRIEAELTDRLILVPFSGLLALRPVRLGILVKPADFVTTLDEFVLLKADFSVPERFVSRLSADPSARSFARANPNEVFAGMVTTMTPSVNECTRAVTVRALIPNPELRFKPACCSPWGSSRAARAFLPYRKVSIPDLGLAIFRAG